MEESFLVGFLYRLKIGVGDVEGVSGSAGIGTDAFLRSDFDFRCLEGVSIALFLHGKFEKHLKGLIFSRGEVGRYD